MAQKALYPMEILRITQDEYGAFSHKGSLAQDNGGASPSTDDVTRAPYDGTVVRVRQDSSHETYFVSDAPVQLADGTTAILTTLFMHDNVLDVTVGQTRKRGEKIGDEGGFGRGRKDAFARHTHIEVARGKQTTQVRNRYGVYVLPNIISLYNAFFVAADTLIVYGAAHTWKRTDELLIPSKVQPTALDFSKPLQLQITSTTCEFFTTQSMGAPTGILPHKAVYRVLEYDPLSISVGALRGNWVRFVYAAGEEYYCLVLPDRAKLETVWIPAVGDIVQATETLNVRTAPSTQRTLLNQMKLGDMGEIRDIDGASCYIRDRGWVLVKGTKFVKRAV